MGDCACDVSVNQLDPSAPVSHFFLELTPDCNQACPGCGAMHASHHGPPLSARDWRRVIDRLAPFKPHLRLTGGEPTLHAEFDEILDYVKSQRIPFTLFTNGRWADPARVIRFLSGAPMLEGVLVSLHGARAASHEAFTAAPGSFTAVTDVIRRAARAGLRVCTSTVFTRQNHHEMEALVKLSRALGAERATFSRYIGPTLPTIEPEPGELGLAVETLERLSRNGNSANGRAIHFGAPVPPCFSPNHSHGCMAGFAHATVDPWGNLRPCPHVPLSAGNLLDRDFQTIWDCEAMKYWRRGLLAQCDGCALAGECRGGCLAQAMWRGAARDPLIPAIF